MDETTEKIIKENYGKWYNFHLLKSFESYISKCLKIVLSQNNETNKFRARRDFPIIHHDAQSCNPSL